MSIKNKNKIKKDKNSLDYKNSFSGRSLLRLYGSWVLLFSVVTSSLLLFSVVTSSLHAFVLRRRVFSPCQPLEPLKTRFTLGGLEAYIGFGTKEGSDGGLFFKGRLGAGHFCGRATTFPIWCLVILGEC